MGERRVVHELLRDHEGHDTIATAEDRWRRLVAHRERLAALMRASHRTRAPAAVAYRSSYAARLWALAEAAAPSEPGPAASPHLSIVARGEGGVADEAVDEDG